ncbi:MAG: HAD hydrolase-like protein [Gammaproteobacteria bacterium]|nr:HAD hydrolase-like protein [Gammaproteobacteria bacterium]
MIIKNVIFDFDGTLVDSAPCILTCYKLVLAERNITPNVAINERIIGPPLTETLTLLTGVSKQGEIALMADRFKYHYDERVAAETLPYP